MENNSKKSNPSILEQVKNHDEENFKTNWETLESDQSHFHALHQSYEDLRARFDPKTFSSNLGTLALFYLLSECQANLDLGFITLLRGHVIDSRMFDRRIAEALRYAFFIQINPKNGDNWINDGTKFQKEFKKWIGKEDNRNLLKRELPIATETYKLASNAGTHSTFSVTAMKTDFQRNGKMITFNLLLHDSEIFGKNSNFLLISIFNSLSLHFESVMWWLQKSQIQFTGKDQLSYIFSQRYECAKRRHRELRLLFAQST